MKLLSKIALLVASSAAVVVGTGVQQLRGGEEDAFQQQLLGLKEGVPPPRSHDLSPGWQKNPSERQGEGHAGRRFHARKGRSNDTPRPQRKVQPLTTTSSSLAPQYCTQPEGGCILRYNGRTWNKNGSECEGRCYCNYVNEKNRSRNGGQPAYMCSRSTGDDISLPEDDEGGVPDEELSETATAATPTTTKASKEDRAAEKAARKAEREANRSSKATKSPSMEREEDELTETATTVAPTTTNASKEEAREARKAEREARKAEREANRSSKATKSPSMEREEDELTETATTAAPTTTKASKEEAKEARKAEREARKAEREANRGSKATKSPSAFDATEFAIA